MITNRNEENRKGILGSNEKDIFIKTFARINVKGDGNFLFRSFSKCLYGHEERHLEIRTKVVDYVANSWTTGENEEILKEGITQFTSNDVTEILFACFDEHVIKDKAFYILFSRSLQGGHFPILEEVILPYNQTKVAFKTNDKVRWTRGSSNLNKNNEHNTRSNKGIRNCTQTNKVNRTNGKNGNNYGDYKVKSSKSKTQEGQVNKQCIHKNVENGTKCVGSSEECVTSAKSIKGMPEICERNIDYNFKKNAQNDVSGDAITIKILFKYAVKN